MFALASSIFYFLLFYQPLKCPDMVGVDDDVDNDGDNITIAAANTYTAYHHILGSFTSTLQGLIYLIFKTALWDRHHHPSH